MTECSPPSRHIRQQLPGIPVLVVAMEMEGSQNQLLEEGRRLAEQWGAVFISSGQEEWDGEGELSQVLTISHI